METTPVLPPTKVKIEVITQTWIQNVPRVEDEGEDYVQKVGAVDLEWTEDEEKILVRKVDVRLLPLVRNTHPKRR